jgi:hypothetical protein
MLQEAVEVKLVNRFKVDETGIVHAGIGKFLLG